MKPPDCPSNEAIRLSTLQGLSLLDTEPEERFDRITRIAKRLFRVPIALVSLVDAQRQWFKSCQGLGVRETSRDISFCGHAILSKNIFIVSDTLLDPRFCDNPLVVGDPKIRFYAGVPLTAANGSRLGTLCIIDQVSRFFGMEEQQLMLDLAQIAEQELVSVQLAVVDELKQRNQEMKLLSELSDFLQACLTLEEACKTLTHLIEPLFPGCSGGIFITCASRNRVENRVSWGHLHSQTEFNPESCWSLRRGRSHWTGPERQKISCNHISAVADPAATLCLPMIAQGETLGLFYLSAETSAALPTAKQQLAQAVAEQVALAIANLQLRETLHNRNDQNRRGRYW